VKKVICFIIGFTILAAPLAFAQDTTVVNMRSEDETEALEIHMMLNGNTREIQSRPIGLTPLQITLNSGTVQDFSFYGEDGFGTFTVKATGGVQNWVLDPGNTLRWILGISTGITFGIVFATLLPFGVIWMLDYDEYGALIGSTASLGLGIVGLVTYLRNRATATLVETGF
jgi:hypothetical protein